MATKVIFTAKIVDEETGKVIEKEVEVGGLPGMEEFDLDTGKGFLQTFDRYEKGLLEARNKAGEMVTGELLSSLEKKR